MWECFQVGFQIQKKCHWKPTLIHVQTYSGYLNCWWYEFQFKQTVTWFRMHRLERLVQKHIQMNFDKVNGFYLKPSQSGLTIASVFAMDTHHMTHTVTYYRWVIRYDHFNHLGFKLEGLRENSKIIDSSLQEIWCLLPWDQLQLYADFMMSRSRVVGHPLSSLLAACHTIFNFIAIKSENSD